MRERQLAWRAVSTFSHREIRKGLNSWKEGVQEAHALAAVARSGLNNVMQRQVRTHTTFCAVCYVPSYYIFDIRQAAARSRVLPHTNPHPSPHLSPLTPPVMAPNSALGPSDASRIT